MVTKEKDLVSIIIPLYNAEAYMDKAISSVISQTYDNIEIILIDDGSTDGTLRSARHYAESDSRIKVLAQSNFGPGASRNLGLTQSKGKFICFLDSDDRLTVDAIEIMHAEMDEDIDIVQCRSQKVFPDGRQDNDKWNESKLILDKFSAMNDYLYNSVPVVRFSVWAKLYRKDIIVDVRFPSIKLSEDVVFNSYAISKTRYIKYIPNILHYSTIRDGSLTHSICSLSKINDRIECSRLLYELITSNEQYGFLQKRVTWNVISSYVCAAGDMKKILDKREAKNEVNRIRELCKKSDFSDGQMCVKTFLVKTSFCGAPELTAWIFQKILWSKGLGLARKKDLYDKQ